MPQLDISTYTSQLFWLLISWGILFTFLWKVIVPKMSNKLSKRDERIKELLAEAQHLDAQADNLILEYNKKLSALKQEQKEKLKNVSVFIQKGKEELENSLTEDMERAIETYKISLERSMKELFERLPEGVEEHLIKLINQHFPNPMENDPLIKELLVKEIKKAQSYA